MRHHPVTRWAAFVLAFGYADAVFAQQAPASDEPASVEATREQARAAYQTGVAAYRAGEYEKAFAEFKKAHDLVPAIRAEYWMALSASHLSDHAAARALLEGVLSSSEAERLGPEKLASLRARLDELNPKEEPAPLVPETPSQGAPTSDAAPNSEGERASRWPAYATLSGAAAFGVFATTYTVLALNANDAYQRDHTTAHHDAAQRDALLAGLGAVMAVGLGVTGFVLISGNDSRASSVGSLRLDMVPTLSARADGLEAELTLSL